jgi:hypothetical protein
VSILLPSHPSSSLLAQLIQLCLDLLPPSPLHAVVAGATLAPPSPGTRHRNHRFRYPFFSLKNVKKRGKRKIRGKNNVSICHDVREVLGVDAPFATLEFDFSSA